jgi:hypothetical protein
MSSGTRYQPERRRDSEEQLCPLDLVALLLEFIARTASTSILNSCRQCLFWSAPSDFSWLLAINYSLWPPVIFGSLYMLQSFNNSFVYVKVVPGLSSVAIFSLNLNRKFLFSLAPCPNV